MKKSVKILLFGLVLAGLAAALFLTRAGRAPGFTEKIMPVCFGTEADGELAVRYYDKTPNIPYLGMRTYSALVRQQPLTLSARADGVRVLANGAGGQLLCDPEAGTITAPDWCRFFDQPLPLEGKALGYKDSPLRFIRITQVDYEGEVVPVTLDLARYGISFYADGDDVYLPLSTLSNIMTDIAGHYMICSGETLCLNNLVTAFFEDAPDTFDAERIQAELQGQPRPDDVIRQSYADLCFSLDYFFGHPGVSRLDADIAAKGLDQALTELDDLGGSIKAGLLSPDLREYLRATYLLFGIYLNDGHTSCIDAMHLLGKPWIAENPDACARLLEAYNQYYFLSPRTTQQLLNYSISEQRRQCWGDETYREAGSTAIIRLDSFLSDTEAWDAFCDGEGPMPDDSLGIVLKGLRRASENPAIRHVLLDLSCNNGGSPDVLMAILAVTTGQTQINGFQTLTGQKMTFTFETDTNFDGVFDEKDRELRYDFDYGVLTTRYAFSCGNLFPILMQEEGAVLLGEPTSGGTCSISVGTDADGFCYYMSSCQWMLTDAEWNSVESGCRIDLPIPYETDGTLDYIVQVFGIAEEVPLFYSYFDADALDRMMTEYFAGESALAPAA